MLRKITQLIISPCTRHFNSLNSKMAYDRLKCAVVNDCLLLRVRVQYKPIIRYGPERTVKNVAVWKTDIHNCVYLMQMKKLPFKTCNGGD